MLRRSFAVVLALVLLSGGIAAQQRTTAREASLQRAVNADPANVAAWLELAQLQEARGAQLDAQRTLTAAVAATKRHSDVLIALGNFHLRAGAFDQAIAFFEELAATDPGDPVGHHVIAAYYWDKAYKDTSLSPAQRIRYAEAGIAAETRALAINPNYVDALVYKGLLLRVRAMEESDPARQRQMIAEATALQEQAKALKPPAEGTASQAPVRVGSGIKPPDKLVDVRPVYPAIAQSARVQGLVVLECTIDPRGNVTDAKVLRSIPLLDAAAIDAVMQWKFRPTLLNDIPVPVIMTVTVQFSLK